MSNSLTLHPSVATADAPSDLAAEIARVQETLDERRRELSELQSEFRAFKIRYAQTVGARLAELEEVERAVKKAEESALGIEGADDDEAAEAETKAAWDAPAKSVGATTLRKLFWSIAKLFHPDHAADETEARRRHTIMAEASRAYGEGDLESLNLLLGDEHLLRSHCATNTNAHHDAPADLAADLLNLQEELRTIEFGLKRIHQDALYQLKCTADEEALQGRDALAESAKRISRQITKARRRLEHMG